MMLMYTPAQHRGVPEQPRRAVDRVLLDRGRRGREPQVASNVVLAELSWTNAQQTQTINRVHRIGQSDPVTA